MMLCKKALVVLHVDAAWTTQSHGGTEEQQKDQNAENRTIKRCSYPFCLRTVCDSAVNDAGRAT